jgi:hypothetical protein
VNGLVLVARFAGLIKIVIMRNTNDICDSGALVIFSCKPNHQSKASFSFAPKVVEARGYVVPEDSTAAEPEVIPGGKPRVVSAGKPKVILTNTNVHPAGIPRVVIAAGPKGYARPVRIAFPSPKQFPLLTTPIMAGIPEVVNGREAYTKDQNPQNFRSFGKLQGLKGANVWDMVSG